MGIVKETLPGFARAFGFRRSAVQSESRSAGSLITLELELLLEIEIASRNRSPDRRLLNGREE